MEIGNDIGFVFDICCTGDAFRFIQHDVQCFLFLTNRFAIHQHHISFLNPVAFMRIFSVDGHAAFINVFIRFTPAAEAGITYVFIKTCIQNIR